MTKKTVFIFELASLLVGYVFTHPLWFGICFETYIFGGNQRCSDMLIPELGNFLLKFALLSFLISITLHFLRDEVFNFWLKFAYIWIPLSALIIFTTQTSSNAWAIGGPTRETVSWIMGGLFVAISFVLIAYKSFTLKKTRAGE